MKQVYLIFAMVSLFVFETGLFSQNVISTSDTTWTYDFMAVDDSVLTGKTILTWQDSANTTLQGIHRAIPPEGEWTLGTRFYREYNGWGKQTFALQINWSDADQRWIDNHRWETFYDSRGNDTLHYSSYKHTADSEWTSALGYQNVNTYDGLDQLLVKEVYEGYPEQEQLKKKHEYTYNPAGNLILELTYHWTGVEWQTLNKFESVYDAEGRQTELVSSSWYSYEQRWTYSTKYVYGYDAAGNQKLTELSAWDETNSLWGVINRDDYTFLPDGHLDVRINQTIPAWGEPFITTKYQYAYNLAGKQDTLTVSELQDATEEYQVTQKQFTSYGGYDLRVYDSICEGDTYFWEGLEIDTEGIYREELVSVMGTDSIRTLYLTIRNCVGMEELPSAEILLYPVPVKEVLQVQCDLDFLEIGVVDLSGREVAVDIGTYIDLSHLEAGTYLVRLKDREGALIGTRKIMKE